MAESEETTAVREAAREIASRFDREYFRELIAKEAMPTDFWKALAGSGLLGIGLPESLGGSGGGVTEEAALVEELGIAGIVSPFLIANFTRKIVARFGTDAQRASYLPPTLDGEHVTAFALTEADAGTNTFALRTKAERDGDSWVVNGQKIYISSADEASQMLLVARTGKASAEQRTSGLSLFIVNLPVEGLSMTRMNTRVSLPEHQCILHLDDVRLPSDALVGEEGQAINYIFTALNAERILAAAMYGGLGRYLLNRGVEFARTRAPFDRPIGEYQAIQHKLAKPYIALEGARAVTFRAAEEFDGGRSAGVLSNSAKYLAAEATADAFDAAVQVHGGQAFDIDTDLLTYYDQVRLMKVAPINDEMVLNFIAQQALRLPKSY